MTTYTVEWISNNGTLLCCESVPVVDLPSMCEAIESQNGEIRHITAEAKI